MRVTSPAPIPPGAGRRKAARLVQESRRRAGLGQTQLARIAGIAVRTLTRIEAGGVVPRFDTVERLLLACGRTLSTEPRATEVPSDGATPLEPRAGRALRFLAGAGVEHVVVGALAARMHDVATAVSCIEILFPGAETQRRRLLRALAAIDRRWSRIPMVATELSWVAYTPIRRAAILLGSVPSPVACLDDLIELADEPRRRAALAAIREARDAG